MSFTINVVSKEKYKYIISSLVLKHLSTIHDKTPLIMYENLK